jgi:hypothetical protein
MSSSTDTAGASKFVAVTPSDSTVLAATRGLYIGVAGDVYIDGARQGTNVKMKAAVAGEHPWQVTRVYSTGTTATDIVALY